MRIVALEEHFILPDLTRRLDPEALARRGWPAPGGAVAAHMPVDELADLGPGRLADMDGAGVSVQVLSLSGAGAEMCPPDTSLAHARDINDRLAAAVAAHPDRYAGFAHLPMSAPEAAAGELERAVRTLGFKGAMVNGTTHGLFLDDPAFDALLAKAEELDCPIYIHPSIPPMSVRQAYYDRLPGGTGGALATAAWGWHQETAIHVLRMILAGTLDTHPKLKLIIGHMGEGLAAMMGRCDSVLGGMTARYLSRSVSQTINDQVWITTSGFFSAVPFMAALTAFGVDRLLFSVDYPFATNAAGTAFLRDLPISMRDKAKIAHENADRLLALS